MIRLLLVLTVVSASVLNVGAQSFCGPTSTYLACQFPFSVRTFGPKTTAFNSTFAVQLSQLPVASAASGFVLTLDKTLGIYTASAGSLGPVLTQRGDTIGKYKLFLAFSYQRFQFNSIDGVSIDRNPSIDTGRGLPLVFNIPAPNLLNTTVYGQTQNRIDTHVDQYVALATFGLTDRIDISVAIPIQRIAIAVSTAGVEHFVNSVTNVQTGSVPFSQYVPGSASGIGDVVVGGKATVLKGEKMSLAFGTDVRFPSGNEKNFLGSGAYGFKPYLAFSRTGRISPHLNFGYQWNSFSALFPNPNGGGNLRLPDSITYAAGADVRVVKKLTFAADLIGTRFFDAPRVRPTTTGIPDASGQPVQTPDLASYKDSYDANELALGVKINPVGKLVIYGNVLLKLDDPGLRAKYIPLVGVSYKF